MPEIELKGVSKSFGPVKALDNVSIRVEDTEYAVLLGPSGCGKTTLLKTIAGLHKPDSGQVLIDGRDMAEIPPEKRDIGFFFQNYALFPHMTVIDNVEYGLQMRGVDADEAVKRAEEILSMMGLGKWGNVLPKQLSGGMQQRAALARALSVGCKTLLLDEPLSAVDAKIADILRWKIVEFAKEFGLTVIHVTPNQDEAMDVSEKVILMREGKIIQSGTDVGLYKKPSTPYAAYFVGESTFIPARMIGSKKAVFRGMEIHTKKRISSERVLLAIRSEKILFEKRDKNTFTGKVDAVNFLGTVFRYEVGVGGKTIVLETAKHPELKVGDVVSVYIPPEDLMVFEEFTEQEYELNFD